ncbi:MAG TPA: DUF3152 domain-containing protein [Candidatus Limnocylindrales bacterium]|nr:DUF3152 domain-containing protein [Candidatus Limnocylindrales bacterium]
MSGNRGGRWASLPLIIVVVLVAIAIILDREPDWPWSSPAGSPEAGPDPREDELPSSGPGTFLYDNTTGPELGGGGPVKRFSLAVESNVEVDLGEFSRLTDATLADRRGWAFEKKQGFQRVPDEAPSDFTIALATRETAFRLCAKAGLDIRDGGIPYTSCQAGGWVVINLDRWRLSTPDYVRSGTPLLTYRQYVINHEVGHQLGHGHEDCPGEGQPAPIMQQQTLGLQGCLANPWPHPTP